MLKPCPIIALPFCRNRISFRRDLHLRPFCYRQLIMTNQKFRLRWSSQSNWLFIICKARLICLNWSDCYDSGLSRMEHSLPAICLHDSFQNVISFRLIIAAVFYYACNESIHHSIQLLRNLIGWFCNWVRYSKRITKSCVLSLIVVNGSIYFDYSIVSNPFKSALLCRLEIDPVMMRLNDSVILICDFYICSQWNI